MRTVRLGDVLEERRKKVAVDPAADYPLAGVYGFGRGMLIRDPLRGADIAAPHLFQLELDQVIYSRLKAFEGAFAVVTAEASGRYVSNEFPTFDVDRDQALPAFIGLVLALPATWSAMAEFITGMGSRRERLQVPDFLDFEFDLPELPDQQVGLAAIARFDRLVVETESELEALEALYRSHLDAAVESYADQAVCMSDIVDRIVSGRSPRCEDRRPKGGEWGVLKVSSVRQLEFDPREAKKLPDSAAPFAKAEIRDGDLLTIRASGSRRLVGAFCIAEQPPPNLLMSDYHWRVEVDRDRVRPRFLAHAMGSSSVREALDLAIVGSTTAAKLSRGRLLELDIPLPRNLAEQDRVTDDLDRVNQLVLAQRAELRALTSLRSAAASEVAAGASLVSRAAAA